MWNTSQALHLTSHNWVWGALLLTFCLGDSDPKGIVPPFWVKEADWVLIWTCQLQVAITIDSTLTGFDSYNRTLSKQMLKWWWLVSDKTEQVCPELNHLMCLSNLVACNRCALWPQGDLYLSQSEATRLILGWRRSGHQGNTTPIRRHTDLPPHGPTYHSHIGQALKMSHFGNIWGQNEEEKSRIQSQVKLWMLHLNTQYFLLNEFLITEWP